MTSHISIAPIIQYFAGNLGQVQNVVQIATGRRYSVIEGKINFEFHFGRANVR